MVFRTAEKNHINHWFCKIEPKGKSVQALSISHTPKKTHTIFPHIVPPFLLEINDGIPRIPRHYSLKGSIHALQLFHGLTITHRRKNGVSKRTKHSFIFV